MSDAEPVADRIVVRRLGRLARSEATPATLVVRGPEVRCAFCHDGFAAADAPFFCTTCRALLHDGCWREAGRCPSLGCRGPIQAEAEPGPRSVEYLAAALHGLTVVPYLVLALVVFVRGDAPVLLPAVVVAAGAVVAYPRRPHADATWLVALSGVALSVAACLLSRVGTGLR